MLTADAPVLLLQHDGLEDLSGKTGLALLRYRQGPVVAVLDPGRAGADLPTLTGIPRPVPVVASVADAVALFNRYSPHFAASLVSNDQALHDEFYQTIDAPFVGNGFTRWVDGQFAFDQPELGLSNWQAGRLFARGRRLNVERLEAVARHARHLSRCGGRADEHGSMDDGSPHRRALWCGQVGLLGRPAARACVRVPDR